jgi:aminomethyltransferase
VSEATQQRTALNQWHKDRGARMVEFCGWDMPVQYKLGIIPSHLHTRRRSGVFDVSHMLQLRITGRDRFDFLESLTVADVRGLPQNGATLSLLLTDQGTIIDDTMITRNEDHIYMVVNAGCAVKDMQHLQAALASPRWKGKDVQIRSLSEQWSLVALQGPDSAAVLAKAMGGGDATEKLARIPFLGSFTANVFGRPCYVSRLGYTGEDGFEIAMNHQDAVHVTDSLVGDESAVIPVGLGARDTLRLEAGLCLYGNDIDDTVTPIEASLAWTIAPARRVADAAVKFPGFDIVMKQLNENTWTKKRVGIAVDGRRPPAHPTDIFKDGKKVGRVTSGTVSPVLDKGIGMAYLDRPHHLQKTTGLYLEIRGKKLDIAVTPMPWVAHTYYKKN